MKTIAVICTILILPFLVFSQKGQGQGKGKGHSKGGKKEYYKQSSDEKPFKKSTTVNYKDKKHKGPPYWAPAHGYRHRNIYFPQYKCYYDTYDGVYIYLSGTRWIRTYSPPSFMVKVDLNLARKVELDLDVAEPQIHFEQHIILYPPFP